MVQSVPRFLNSSPGLVEGEDWGEMVTDAADWKQVAITAVTKGRWPGLTLEAEGHA